ncbi:glycosyltransferase family 2 protein [Akkermansiaceae bacterium]|nr:glycosyltransferase family 2 protein [Akkermansiaceae bacterium]
MLITVICPTFNEEGHISRLLEDMVAQSISQDTYELLIVDGGSSDKTVAIIEKFVNQFSFIKFLKNPKKIVPCAMNLGISRALGKIIIRVDAHSSYPKDYLLRLSSSLEELNADNVGAVCITDVINKNRKTLAIREVLSSKFGVGNSLFRTGVDKVTEVDTVPFGCYKKEVFERLGFFNTQLVRNQDIEFNSRIKRAGGKIFLLPDLRCRYYARERFRDLFKNNYNNGKWNILTIYFTNKLDSLSLRHFIPLTFLASLFAPILGSLFWFPFIYLAIFSFGLYFFLMTFISFRISKKKRTNLAYLLTAFITLHTSYGLGSLTAILGLPFKKLK